LTCFVSVLNLELKIILYGCETWSLTPREEHRLTAFENRVLRKIIKPEGQKAIEWTQLRNKELHIMFLSRTVITVIK